MVKHLYLLIMAVVLFGFGFMEKWEMLSGTLAVLLLNAYYNMSEMSEHYDFHIHALHTRIRALEQGRVHDLVNQQRLMEE